MSRLLNATLITTLALSANSEVLTQKQLMSYVKRSIIKNPRVKVKNIEITEVKTDTRIPDWKVIFTAMKLTYQGKEITAPLMLFKNGNIITSTLYDLNSSTDYTQVIKASIPDSVYNDEHLIYGTKNSSHKILVFSDPQCPFCQDVMPDIFKAAKEHPDLFALYYYHLPLKRLHPVSDTLTKVMHIAQKEGRKDIFEDMYKLEINIRETNEDKILEKIKKQFNYTLTKEQLNTPEVKKVLKADEDIAAKLMIQGTPTVYFDGEFDKMRDGYEKYLPKKEDKNKGQ